MKNSNNNQYKNISAKNNNKKHYSNFIGKKIYSWFFSIDSAVLVFYYCQDEKNFISIIMSHTFHALKEIGPERTHDNLNFLDSESHKTVSELVVDPNCENSDISCYITLEKKNLIINK